MSETRTAASNSNNGRNSNNNNNNSISNPMEEEGKNRQEQHLEQQQQEENASRQQHHQQQHQQPQPQHAESRPATSAKISENYDNHNRPVADPPLPADLRRIMVQVIKTGACSWLSWDHVSKDLPPEPASNTLNGNSNAACISLP
jgi:hypothetical protein